MAPREGGYASGKDRPCRAGFTTAERNEADRIEQGKPLTRAPASENIDPTAKASSHSHPQHTDSDGARCPVADVEASADPKTLGVPHLWTRRALATPRPPTDGRGSVSRESWQSEEPR